MAGNDTDFETDQNTDLDTATDPDSAELNRTYTKPTDPRRASRLSVYDPNEADDPGANAPEPDLWEIGADGLRAALEVMRVIRLAAHPETRQHLYNLADKHGIDSAEVDASVAATSPEVARLNADPAYAPQDSVRPSQYPGVGPSRTPGTAPTNRPIR